MLIETLENEIGSNVSDEIKKITGMINDKSSQLILMIERLLEFSKMCNIKPQFSELDINTILNETFSELKSLEPERKITMISGTLPLIMGDAVLIKLCIV